MGDLEQRAREMLAAEYREAGMGACARAVEMGHFEVEVRAITKALSREAELEEALRRAAAVFDGYAEMHRAKLSPVASEEEKASILAKVERNEQHAMEARSALHGERGEGGK